MEGGWCQTGLGRGFGRRSVLGPVVSARRTIGGPEQPGGKPGAPRRRGPQAGTAWSVVPRDPVDESGPVAEARETLWTEHAVSGHS